MGQSQSEPFEMDEAELRFKAFMARVEQEEQEEQDDDENDNDSGDETETVHESKKRDENTTDDEEAAAARRRRTIERVFQTVAQDQIDELVSDAQRGKLHDVQKDLAELKGLTECSLHKLKLNREVGVNDKNRSEGLTALMNACVGGEFREADRLVIVKYLVEIAHANVDLQDGTPNSDDGDNDDEDDERQSQIAGITALMIATDSGDMEIVRYLVEHAKADIGIVNVRGKGAIEIAEDCEAEWQEDRKRESEHEEGEYTATPGPFAAIARWLKVKLREQQQEKQEKESNKEGEQQEEQSQKDEIAALRQLVAQLQSELNEQKTRVRVLEIEQAHTNIIVERLADRR